MNIPLTLDQPQAVRLDGWGVLRARGEDARSFLNGQLTQDLPSPAPGEARLAGYCSAKGRLLATFVAWSAADDEWLLACSADLLPQTLRRLSMFVLRARCKLDDASAQQVLWGLALPPGAAPDIPAQPWQTQLLGAGTAIRLPDVDGWRRVLWCAAEGAAPPCPATPDTGWWDWLEVQSGVPRVSAATLEAFVPQMVNLEVVGGVSFRKGCYPGQEVVARSQYRGTLKRRLYLARSDAPAAPGAEVFAADDPAQPAGQVVLGASLAGTEAAAPRHAAQVELKCALAHAEARLHLGAPDGPLMQLVRLPYELPAQAD